MTAATETENWRKKYFDSLSSIENEQKQFRAMETSLKRIAGRLCTAALGQSAQLDEQLKKLQHAIRRDASSIDLDQITPALTDAIGALDHEPATPAPVAAAKTATPAPVPIVAPSPTTLDAAPAPAIVDERVRALLSALLGELRGDPELVDQVDALDAKLTAKLTVDELSSILSPLTALVARRIKRIESAKQEIEVLLSHMVGKLDEIGQFVAEQNRSQSESQASSETLNVKLASEMKAMGESVEATSDLQQVRAQVRNRIDLIDRHLREFRERETLLATAMRSRSEQMRTRIEQLEGEAKRLHAQLQDEQRLSTLDALTKIPNRHAYEKRVDEELKRWQRFEQATCLAVWDVDRFKHVNDTYGHRAGDRVLQAVAECFATRIRSTDFIARYGGEEFVLLLPGTKLTEAMRVVEDLRIAIASIGFHFRGTPISITISAGVTTFLANDSAGAAFERADKAMYQAKNDGRNRCLSG